MSVANTLTAALKQNLSLNRAITFINSADDETQISLQQLQQHALGVLHFLQQKIEPKQELIIHLDDNRQFIDVFWACLFGNIIPVPIAIGNNDQHRQKLINVFQQLKNPKIITTRQALHRINLYANANNLDIKKLTSSVILIDHITSLEKPGQEMPINPDDIALIQFSSGSTGKPKGVVLTHKNILTNVNAMMVGAKTTQQDKTLSWMPLTHDMGIIGFHLVPLVAGMEQFIMPTELFIRRPLLWLSKTSEHQATLIASPNFGYQHCLNFFKPEKMSGLKLNSVRLILNGAEPISASLCQQFLQTMAPFGLNPNSMFPVYGLAEASLAVSFPEPGTPLQSVFLNRQQLQLGQPIELTKAHVVNAAEFISTGQAVTDCEVGVFTEEQPAVENTVGQIKIRGNNVTQGYYQDAETTAAAINQDGWLNTGDLGFFHQNNLYIVGRAKELIIINGQNFAAHDLEKIASNETINFEKIIACSVQDQTSQSEQLLLFVLFKGDHDQFMPIAKQMQQKLSLQVGISALHIIPITKIPKTTSGKVQRYQLVERFYQGEFNDLLSQPTVDSTAAASAKTTIEHKLLDICHNHLKTAIGPNDNIFDTGTSSLTLAQIFEDIDALYPNTIEVTDIFDYPTIAELGKYIESQREATV